MGEERALLPSAESALVRTQQGEDMYEVERMALSQAGLNGFDQLGAHEQEDFGTDWIGDKQREKEDHWE